MATIVSSANLNPTKSQEDLLKKSTKDKSQNENCIYDGIITFLPKLSPFQKILHSSKNQEVQSLQAPFTLQNRSVLKSIKIDQSIPIAPLANYKKIVKVYKEEALIDDFSIDNNYSSLRKNVDIDQLKDPYKAYLNPKNKVKNTPFLMTLQKNASRNSKTGLDLFSNSLISYYEKSALSNVVEEEYMLNLLKHPNNATEFFDAFKQEREGANTLVDFLIHKRQIKTVCDQNKYAKLTDSVLTILLKETHSQKLPPRFLGLCKFGNNPLKLNLKQMRLPSEYLLILAKVLPITEVKSVDLSGNKMTSEVCRIIIESLPSSVKKLTLSDCQVSIPAIIAKLANANNKIKQLNLRNCNLKNTDAIQLLSVLCEYPKLNVLDLSENNLTDEITIISQKLLEDQNSMLCHLYLRDNQLSNKFMAKIGRSLATNSRLKLLDLSHNNFGSQIKTINREEPIQTKIEDKINGKDKLNQKAKLELTLSEIINSKNEVEDWMISLLVFISANTSVVHLDLSANKFTVLDSQFIALALTQNKSIFGFHFNGNFGTVNWNGQLYTNLKSKDLVYAHSKRQIHGFKPSKCVNSFASNRILKFQNYCWICEDWRQIKLTVHKSSFCFFPVFVHFEHTAFEPFFVDFKDQLTFEIKMYFPGERVRYFFTEAFQFSHFMLPKSVKQEIKEEFFEVLNQFNDQQINIPHTNDVTQKHTLNDQNPAATNSLQFLGSPNFQRAFIVNSGSLSVCKYIFNNNDYKFNTDLPFIHNKDFKSEHSLSMKIGQVIDQLAEGRYQNELITPRTERTVYLKSKELNVSEWTVEKSLFDKNRKLSLEDLNALFEIDFKQGNLSFLVENSGPDLGRFKSALFSFYNKIRQVHLQISSKNTSMVITGSTRQQLVDLYVLA